MAGQSSRTVKAEPLLLEWLQNGVWYGRTSGPLVDHLRAQAMRELARTPERYWYVFPERVRVSYREPT
jgi:hypothetical protein